MRTRLAALPLLCLMAVSVVHAEDAAPNTPPEGYVALFNGKDLSGWKTYPDMASKFTVTEQGAINVKNGSGQLESKSQYADFVLQLECISHAEGLNSGVFFRCIPGEQMNGYECQIHNGFKDGNRAMPVDHGTGGIFRRQPARRCDRYQAT